MAGVETHLSRPFPDPSQGLLLGGIFNGIGGWEFAAGKSWTPCFAAEIDKYARKCFEVNFGKMPDVTNILTAPSSSAKFAHVYCISFPCQSSSQAGLRKGRKDPRGGKVLSKALSMVQHARPIIVVFENVKGFLTVDGGSYFNFLRKRLNAIGYPYFNYKVLGTHQFGIPQRRERLYMIAGRADVGDIDFRFPVGNETCTPSLSRFIHKRLSKRYANTIRCGGRGSKDRHAWDMVPRAKGGGWYQLSISDCKALMGFPSDFVMPIPATHQFRLLGNAITIEPAKSIMDECERIVRSAYNKLKRPHD